MNISWLDAVLFCNKLSETLNLMPYYQLENEEVKINEAANGYRLPTDAEWQYACKAGISKYQYDAIEKIAWYDENSDGQVHEVGRKSPNAWGLYDMLGNVWEWCWDLYDEEIYGTYRIFRGGSWAEQKRSSGASSRRRSHPSFRIDDLGFRLARSI